MEKNITLIDERLLEEFLSVFGIGLAYCVEAGLIDTIRAEEWLFSPNLAYSLKTKMVSKGCIHAMKYASELDATKGSDYYMKSVLEAKKLFMDNLKKLNFVEIIPKKENTREMFLYILHRFYVG
ncbi:MAG: hypothetical protein LBL18_05350 [Bacteroidales bacterium]|nr:hypothetical protein [Bacteroidales bacterium]